MRIIKLRFLCLFSIGVAWTVFAQNIEQRTDEMFATLQRDIDQRVSEISIVRLRANHADRLWNRHALLLNRKIRLWNQQDRTLYQLLQTKIIERKKNYLTTSTSDLVQQRELINAINTYRDTKHLSPLAYNSKLTEAAYRHALDLSRHFPYDTDGDGKVELISHIGTDGTRVVQRVQDTWYMYNFLAENIAYNQVTANQVLYDWINSPKHHDNLITNKAKDIGIAKIGPYWVMVIGRS